MLKKLPLIKATAIFLVFLVVMLFVSIQSLAESNWYPWITLGHDKEGKVVASLRVLSVGKRSPNYRPTPSPTPSVNQETIDVIFELEDGSSKRISFPLTTCFDDMCGFPLTVGESWKEASVDSEVVELALPIKKAQLVYQGKELASVVDGKGPFEITDISYERTPDQGAEVSWKVISDLMLDYYTEVYIKNTEVGSWQSITMGGHRNAKKMALLPVHLISATGRVWVKVELQQGLKTIEKQIVIDIPHALPFAKLYAPMATVNYNPGTALELQAHTLGNLGENDVQFTWTSSIDGEIAWVPRAQCYYMSPGKHTITMIAKNIRGEETRESVDVTVDVANYFSTDPQGLNQYLRRIKDNQEDEFCSGQFRKRSCTPGDGKCFSHLAKFTKEVSLCEQAGDLLPDCYSDFAMRNTNLDYCLKIPVSKGERELVTCVAGIACSKKDISICDNLPDVSQKDTCAVYAYELSECTDRSNPISIRELCKKHTARTLSYIK
jgi:hypothetical protein